MKNNVTENYRITKPYTGNESHIRMALREYQVRMNLSGKSMAALLGTTTPHYSEMMGGKRHFSYRMARNAYKMGIDADTLLT